MGVKICFNESTQKIKFDETTKKILCLSCLYCINVPASIQIEFENIEQCSCVNVANLYGQKIVEDILTELNTSHILNYIGPYKNYYCLWKKTKDVSYTWRIYSNSNCTGSYNDYDLTELRFDYGVEGISQPGTLFLHIRIMAYQTLTQGYIKLFESSVNLGPTASAPYNCFDENIFPLSNIFQICTYLVPSLLTLACIKGSVNLL